MYSKIFKISFLGLFLFFTSNFIANSQNLINNGSFVNDTTGWTIVNYTPGESVSVLTDFGNNYIEMHH